MRKISIIGSVLLIVAAYFANDYLAKSKKPLKQKKGKIVKTVFVKPVLNSAVPLSIEENGNLVAKNKIVIYSEVQGLLEDPANKFRAGKTFKKGTSIIAIDNEDFKAGLIAQKSAFQNLLVSIMPDLKSDYPTSFDKWNSYLKNLDLHKPLEVLPEPVSDKEKYFISGKNIATSYYNIKSQEGTLANYEIIAPYDGILTEATMTAGTLVRPGQKLGEFINPNVFELPLSVNGSYASRLKIGKEVTLTDVEKLNSWTGKVTRINGRIDQNSQTVQVFVEVKGEGLREGLYLQANVNIEEVDNALEVSRKLLVNNSFVYIVENGMLKLEKISVVHSSKSTVTLTGLENGILLVEKPVPGAFENMKVKIFDDSKK
jgi:multidrug efflux pump subunit AcrA (membrane-fusion protein)